MIPQHTYTAGLTKKAWVCCCILLMGIAVSAQVHLAPIFSSNMVLQRNQPIPIWGTGTPGAQITIHFAGKSASGMVASDSSWKIILPPLPMQHIPQALLVTDGNHTVNLTNILLGDIWLCIGQSNMEWPLQREAHYAEVKNTAMEGLRFFNPPYAGKHVYGTPFTDSMVSMLSAGKLLAAGSWQECNPESLPAMSATAFYFGKKIRQRTGIPIGLIHLGIGGAPLETFIARETLATHPLFHRKVTGNWLDNPYLPEWIRERGRQNTGGGKDNGNDSTGPAHAFKPGFAFETAIKPLLGLPIAGLICYQGESNAQEPDRVKEYAALFSLLVHDYRAKWKSELPVFFVQLSSIDSTGYKSQYWPWMRDEQRSMAEHIRHTGMAVSSDIGHPSDVHPTNKKDVGERLALHALQQVYRQKVVAHGPLPRKAVYRNGSVIISFRNVSGGLQTKGDTAVSGFSCNGKDAAPAFIKRNKIILPTSTKPPHIYYGWQPFSTGNLYNATGLPASTFRINILK